MLACFWLAFKKLDIQPGVERRRILQDDVGMSRPDEYIESFYFIMTTLTTVGYGDISPTSEGQTFTLMVFGILLLAIGVGSFSVLVGQLTTLIMDFNTSDLIKGKKLELMADVNDKYQLDVELYAQIKSAITYEI